MKFYNAKDWYWFVGGNLSKVFSSKTGDYVLVNDPAYLSWASDGTIPTRILTETELGEVLATQQVRPTQSGVLDGYTSSLADGQIAATGFKIMFNHENRIRAIERALGLNGSPPNLTPAQAKNAVKALM